MKRSNKLFPPTPKELPIQMRVYEIRSGHDLTWDGFAVYAVSTERILGWVQSLNASMFYDSEADEAKDRIRLLRVARACACDPDKIALDPNCIDMRDMGHLDAREEMIDDAYGWHLYEPNTNWSSHSFQWFPFCPFKFRKMLDQRDRLLHIARFVARRKAGAA